MLRTTAALLPMLLLLGCQTMNNVMDSSKNFLGLNDDGIDSEPTLSTADAPAPKPAPAPAPAAEPPANDPTADLKSPTDAPLSSIEVANQSYADESKNEGLPPVSSLLPAAYRAATPNTLAGGKLITTYELHQLLKADKPVIMINALQGDSTQVIPGSVWLSGAGENGRFSDAVSEKLDSILLGLTNNKRDRTLVFYCLDSHCWYAYNAALRATNLGYSNVYWYRGGLKSWNAAGLPHSATNNDTW